MHRYDKRQGRQVHPAGLIFGERVRRECCDGPLLMQSATIGRRRKVCSSKCRQQFSRGRKKSGFVFGKQSRVTKCQTRKLRQGCLASKRYYEPYPNVR